MVVRERVERRGRAGRERGLGGASAAAAGGLPFFHRHSHVQTHHSHSPYSYHPSSSHTATKVIFWATLVVLIFYGIEVIFKMVGCGARVFMRDRWNWFDLVVLGCSILTMEDQGGTVLIARFGKNVRFLRNIKAGE